LKSLKIEESLVLDLKIFMYRNADEIERLKKIKEDSDREAASTLQQLKTLLESRDSMHRELVELREVKDATLEVVEAMDIPERDGDEPLALAGRLRKVPGAFERFVSTITRQYIGHVLGLVKSYWPTTRLDARGQGAKADYMDDQFRRYLAETSGVADQIIESLSKAESP
jgi:hypothetical protein